MNQVTLGDLLIESETLSTKPTPEKRITVKLNVKGVEKRGDVSEKEGATKYYTRRAGQFIYGKQNFHKGAFGIIPPELNNYESSKDIPAFDIRKDCLPEWIYYFFKQGKFYETLEKYAIGRGSRRIHFKQIKDLQIPFPKITEQKRIIQKIKALENQVNILNEKLKTQLEYNAQLEQSLLQEAIKGKLTPPDLKSEPASALLEKIKRGNALPQITEKEIPFELPKNWQWTRLGEICDKIGSGSTPRGGKSVYKDKGIKFIRSQNVFNDELNFDNIAFIDNETHTNMSGTKVIANDILLNITGGSIGRCALVPHVFDEANVSQHVTIIRLKRGLVNKFFHLTFLSPYFQDRIMEVQTGGNREGLAKKNMQLMLVPIPPYKEQIQIVEKVINLTAYSSKLEEKILMSQKQIETLMDTILSESFILN